MLSQNGRFCLSVPNRGAIFIKHEEGAEPGSIRLNFCLGPDNRAASPCDLCSGQRYHPPTGNGSGRRYRQRGGKRNGYHRPTGSAQFCAPHSWRHLLHENLRQGHIFSRHRRCSSWHDLGMRLSREHACREPLPGFVRTNATISFFLLLHLKTVTSTLRFRSRPFRVRLLNLAFFSEWAWVSSMAAGRPFLRR